MIDTRRHCPDFRLAENETGKISGKLELVKNGELSLLEHRAVLRSKIAQNRQKFSLIQICINTATATEIVIFIIFSSKFHEMLTKVK